MHKNAIFPSVGIIYGDNKFTLVTEKWLDYEFIAEWWDFKKHFGNLYLKEALDKEKLQAIGHAIKSVKGEGAK